MSLSRTIRMPDGSTYPGRFGHWLPKLLGSDDTVLGETAYFRLGWYGDGTLASPSPGHLGHAGIHVRQYRAMRAAMPGWLRWAAKLWWPAHWLLHRERLEAEAVAFATSHAHHPVLVAAWEGLRAIVRRSQ